jgi:hypothetical protein
MSKEIGFEDKLKKAKEFLEKVELEESNGGKLL